MSTVFRHPGVRRGARPHCGLVGGLSLALVLAQAALAPAQDMVRLSVKHILNKDGVRSSGIYLFDLAVIETVWEMNKALADMGIRWRFDLVDQVEVSGASEYYTFEDTDENERAFELEAREDDPTRFHWRHDAINIFVVNDITGFAGGFASFPGQDGSHRDIILIQSQWDGEINSLAGGWLHEIGHYLSLEHTFTCPDKDCKERTCVGTGAFHRDWEVKCPDVCPDDNNIMSYNDTKGAFKITGVFTQCQIDNMNFELYDPRGERGNVIYPCSEACAQKAASCKQACEGVRSACYSTCDAAYTVCHGGCAFVGDACRGVCEATGDTCRAGCTAAVATCDSGCDVVCFFDDDAPACVACRRECAKLRADCEAPCNQVEADCKAGCPSPADCDADCESTRSDCRTVCDQAAQTCLIPCQQIENDCLRDCQAWPAPPVNLARQPGVTATQSSTYGGALFPAALAIDGNVNTFSHTDAADTGIARWSLDLGAEFDLETIVLENRRDCCPSRLRDITVIVRDPEGNPTYTSTILNPTNNKVGVGLLGPQRLVLHFPSTAERAVRGRTIDVQRVPDFNLTGTGGVGSTDDMLVLALAEVAVYGNPVPPSPEVNLITDFSIGSAPLQPKATQSSTGYGGEASRATDGNHNGNFFGGSVTHTADGDPAPWWEVDLGYAFPIGRIVLWNRTDCCAGRLSNFKVSLFDSTHVEVHSSLHFSGGGYPDTSESGYEVPEPGVPARWVRIQHLEEINGAGLAVSLAEVEVYAGSAPASASFVRGDANSSGTIDLTDALVVLSYLFTGGAEPACMDAADADDQGPGQPTISDGILILNWLFLGASAPRAPSPSGSSYLAQDCGADPTPDDGMSCAQGSLTCR